MYLQDASSLAEAYDSLFDNFISSNVYAFCQAAWLLPEGKALSTNTLDRMIYAEGDKHEILLESDGNGQIVSEENGQS